MHHNMSYLPQGVFFKNKAKYSKFVLVLCQGRPETLYYHKYEKKFPQIKQQKEVASLMNLHVLL